MRGRGTKTMFAHAHVKWFYGQSEHMYYLNYFIMKVFLKKFFQHMETLDVFTYKPSYSKETQYNYIDNNENDRNSNSNN